jgi:hypothetical protein
MRDWFSLGQMTLLPLAATLALHALVLAALLLRWQDRSEVRTIEARVLPPAIINATLVDAASLKPKPKPKPRRQARPPRRSDGQRRRPHRRPARRHGPPPRTSLRHRRRRLRHERRRHLRRSGGSARRSWPRSVAANSPRVSPPRTRRRWK